MKTRTPKRPNRRSRKAMEQFLKDHGWIWRRPMKLRVASRRLTEGEVDVLLSLRAAATEAGRLRMVSRGLTQYARPGEVCGCGGDPVGRQLILQGCFQCNAFIRACPHCRVIVCVPQGCGHHAKGDVLAAPSSQ